MKDHFGKSTHFLYHTLIEPRSTDEDQKRREYILNVLLVGSIVLLLILDAAILYYGNGGGAAQSKISLSAFSVLPAFFIFLYTLSRKGYFIPASYLLIAAYFISNSYAAYRWGVNVPTVLISYALIIVIASILISTEFAFVITLLTSLFIIPTWYFQIHRVIITQPQSINSSDAVIFAILYFLIMIVAWLSNREIEQSLARAHRSENELTKERDLLEVKVEERTRELQAAQFEKVRQLYRFAEFGQLASGIFHDILGLLNTISLRVERRPNDKRTDAEQFVNATNTAKQIENFMQAMRKQLDYRETDEEFSVVDSIEQVIQLISYKAHTEGVKIVFRHDGRDTLGTFGNPFKFHQVILNLITNAIESYETIPRNEKRTRSVTIVAGREGGTLTVRVEDRGAGIPPEIHEKIFEPFFTTKSRTKGIGIGLASTKKIVEDDFHGTIRIESRPGEGSTFIVTIPIVDPERP